MITHHLDLALSQVI